MGHMIMFGSPVPHCLPSIARYSPPKPQSTIRCHPKDGQRPQGWPWWSQASKDPRTTTSSDSNTDPQAQLAEYHQEKLPLSRPQKNKNKKKMILELAEKLH